MATQMLGELQSRLLLEISEALAEGRSINQMAQESGVPQSSLQRFWTQERELRMGNVDKLLEYFGLGVVRVREM